MSGQVSDGVRVELGDRSTAEALFDPICQLYDKVFSAPPHYWKPEESAQHRERLRRLIVNPAFGIVTAQAGGDLIGFVYGCGLSPGTPWWQGALEPLPDALTREWPGRTFAVIDLAVQELRRGQGLGRRLLESLLGSRSEERATLAVQPAAEEAHAFYQHLGWQKTGRLKGVPGESSPFFDIYLQALRDPG